MATASIDDNDCDELLEESPEKQQLEKNPGDMVSCTSIDDNVDSFVVVRLHDFPW